MGFDVENITPKEIRIEEYYRTEPEHANQDIEVLRVIGVHKSGIGASGIFKYLNEKYPLTSVRRSLNTLLNSSKSKIMTDGKIDSQLFNSSETRYKMKTFQEGLF